MQIHQFHPSVSYGDAISNQIIAIKNILNEFGYKSEIFCRQRPLNFKGKVYELQQFKRFSSEENILILHYSLGYPADVWEWLHNVPDKKIICYHNITPAKYFEGINETFYDAATRGRDELKRLLNMTVAGCAVSRYNRQELVEMGWPHVSVLPIVFDPRRYLSKPNTEILQKFKGKTNVLYVSRISPNKKAEDVIMSFFYLKKYRPDANLIIVGSDNGMDLYREYLDALVKRLQLNNVIFAGHVSDPELFAYYQSASVLVSMSEHEGFGVPLLEAMHFGVPIVAYEAGAIPETLGGSGILVKEKNYHAIGLLIDQLLEDVSLQKKLIARQRQRITKFYPENVQQKLFQLLNNV